MTGITRTGAVAAGLFFSICLSFLLLLLLPPWLVASQLLTGACKRSCRLHWKAEFRRGGSARLSVVCSADGTTSSSSCCRVSAFLPKGIFNNFFDGKNNRKGKVSCDIREQHRDGGEKTLVSTCELLRTWLEEISSGNHGYPPPPIHIPHSPPSDSVLLKRRGPST